MKRKILLILLAILVIIQFIRPSRNQSAHLSSNDITQHYPIPQHIQNILQASCNDCHSNNTTYPWYTNVQPVGWWLQKHINDGKNALNFSEFTSYSPEDQRHVLKELIKEVKNDHMPLNSYLWIHKDAILTDDQKQVIISWAEKLQSEIPDQN